MENKTYYYRLTGNIRAGRNEYESNKIQRSRSLDLENKDKISAEDLHKLE